MPDASTDDPLLRRALRLAMNGRGIVEPNPMVGCVLVRDGQVIGEGWHAQFGGPHAEPAALEDCRRRGNSPAGATAYVTLEPCCHANKKTPPCAPQLIEATLARVVIGCLDPNPQVNGQGVAMLRAAGIAVDGPVLEAEAMQLIAPFLARVRQDRPYVTLKWAETADGKVAGPGGRRMQISNAASSSLVHQFRARSDAILVGINTVLHDDPLLTARGVSPARPLLRVVLDTHLRLPIDGQLARTAGQSPVLVYCGEAALREHGDRAASLRAAGVELAAIKSGGSLPPNEVIADLGRRGVTHLMVEGGPAVHRSFIDGGLADRVWVFRTPAIVDDATAPAAAVLPGHYVTTSRTDLAEDVLTESLNPQSRAFFAATPSADFVLANEVVMRAFPPPP